MNQLVTKKSILALSVLFASLSMTGCGSNDGDNNGLTLNTPSPAPAATPTPSPAPAPTPSPAPAPKTAIEKADFTAFHKKSPITIANAPTDAESYVFNSKFTADKSAVSYTGQTARHALITDFNSKIKSFAEGATSVADDLKIFLEGGNDDLAYDLSYYKGKAGDKSLVPAPNYGDISKGKSLASKTAGQDKPEHIPGTFTGAFGASQPLDLTNKLVALVNEQVTDGKTPTVKTKAGDVAVDVTYVDGMGRDFSQLTNKFLLMSVAFNQGTADYLKTNFIEKNTQETDKNYTTAEHKWDEGFGYFGASRDYGKLTDAVIKDNRVNDTDNNGEIDLRSEVSVGASINCAKRDAGSKTGTDFTKQAFDAFLTGRKILNDAAGASFSDGDDAKLAAAAKQASYVWEQCIAATVVHYVNDTTADLNGFIENDGMFTDLKAYKTMAKHWSEMKGFALGLQLSPVSPFNSSAENKAAYDYMLKDIMGDKPEFDSVDDAKAYVKKLEKANMLLQKAYNFDAKDVAGW